MIEAGMLAGDPCAADGWSREQRVAAVAWWEARLAGAPSAWASGPDDRIRWVNAVAAKFPGLASFLRSGFVILARRK